MNVPSVPVVAEVEKFCKPFRKVLSKPQYAHFYRLVISLLVSMHAHRVTDALRLFKYWRHWTNVYAFLRSQAWSYLALIQTLWGCILDELGNPSHLFIILDDTTVRHAGAKKMEAVKTHFNASAQNDPCRAKLVWGHQWVMLGLAVALTQQNWECLPICAGLVENGLSKLQLAFQMLSQLCIPSSAILTVIADGWYTKIPFLLQLRGEKMHYIGKIRKDARLYEPLPKRSKRKHKRGRPRLKGPRIYLTNLVRKKPEFSDEEVIIRGKKRRLDVWSKIVVLPKSSGLLAKAVVARWKLKNGKMRYLHLISTDLHWSSLEILRYYDARWMIEPCHFDLKQKGGFGSYSGLSSGAHKAWAQLCCIARTLLVLLNTKRKTIGFSDPWRRSTQPDYITTGQRRMELTMNFDHFMQLGQDDRNSSRSGTSLCQRTNFR